MAHVLVLTSDAVPLGGAAATGAGLRALGLGEGLRARGHEVEWAMPADLAERAAAGVLLFEENRLDDFVAASDADVLVFQHWALAASLTRQPRAFVAIDFHGPLILETLYRDPQRAPALTDLKLAALRRGDFFTCAGERQRAYFRAFLVLSGVDVRTTPLEVIPFSLAPDLPERGAAPAEPVFVYGGVFLPWQDPRLGLRVLVEELEAAGRGQLRLYGGRHPWMPLDAGYGRLLDSLAGSDRVVAVDTLPRSELLAEYAAATAAWDLMARNPERELAFTSRTVEYLWCGLPPVYGDYAELASPIEDARAGWTVAPDDEAGIRAVVRAILEDGDDVRSRSQAAQQLVRERLTWDRTIEPLDAFCRAPRRAERLPQVAGAREVSAGVVYVPVSPEVAALLRRLRRLLPRRGVSALRRLLRRRS